MAASSASNASATMLFCGCGRGDDFAVAEIHIRAEFKAGGQRGKRIFADDGGADLGQVALVEIRVVPIDIVRDDHRQYRVAEEFQPLVAGVLRLLRFVGIGGVPKRVQQQLLIAKGIADRLFQPGGGIGDFSSPAIAAGIRGSSFLFVVSFAAVPQSGDFLADLIDQPHFAAAHGLPDGGGHAFSFALPCAFDDHAVNAQKRRAAVFGMVELPADGVGAAFGKQVAEHRDRILF